MRCRNCGVPIDNIQKTNYGGLCSECRLRGADPVAFDSIIRAMAWGMGLGGLGIFFIVSFFGALIGFQNAFNLFIVSYLGGLWVLSLLWALGLLIVAVVLHRKSKRITSATSQVMGARELLDAIAYSAGVLSVFCILFLLYSGPILPLNDFFAAGIWISLLILLVFVLVLAFFLHKKSKALKNKENSF